MRKLTQIVSLLLLSTILFIGCSGTTDSQVNKETDVENKETVSSVIEETTTNNVLPDNLPEKNFEGKVFSVLTEGEVAGFDYATEIVSNELTGEVCNDAIYDRNMKIEERFNTKIAVTSIVDAYQEIVKLDMAGGSEYSLVGIKDHCAQTPIRSGVLFNWLDVPYVDLEQPWHIKLANDGATVNGQLYAIASDLSVTAMLYTYAIYCNTTKALDYGYTSDDFYSLVKDGKWTIDKLIEITDSMYIDVNGDGTKDENDKYGFGYCVVNPADVWMTAFGEQSFTFDKDSNNIEFSFGTEKMADALVKLGEWTYNGKGFYKMTGQYDEEKWFLNNKVILAPLRLNASFNVLRDMEDSYIILPYPKWDEAQDGYYTNADDKFSNFGIPKSMAGDSEFIGVIYEALCAESYNSVYPAYYDVALKNKYSSDATTAEMLDIIMAGRAFDFGAQFYVSYYYKIRDLINEQNFDMASFYESTAKSQRLTVVTFFNQCYGMSLPRK